MELLLLLVVFPVSLPFATSLNGAASLTVGSVQYLICDTDVDITGCLCQVAAAVTARVFSMCASIQRVLQQ